MFILIRCILLSTIERHYKESHMNIRFKKGITKENALLVCNWSNENGREFQEQWMGSQIDYPLTYDKIEHLENVFSIFNDESFLGMIQQIRVGSDSVHIGRFIIDPQKVGIGFGKASMQSFIDMIFDNTCIKSISLTVFDSNQKAKSMYVKLGFEIVDVIDVPRLKYIMKIYL